MDFGSLPFCCLASHPHGHSPIFNPPLLMFAKIFSQIFDSTIADDYEVRHIFMDLLVLADSDGVVDMPMESIARRINVPSEKVKNAMAILEAPDPQSRTPEFEGRRIEKISDRSWGWIILNYTKYRAIATEFDRRSTGRDRTARFRSKDPKLVGSRKGYVYYAKTPNGREVKIGFSANPWSRILELAAARPGIEIIATESTTFATEQLRHKEFSNLHVGGEWFKFDEPLRSFVKSLKLNAKYTQPPVVTTEELRSNYSASASASVLLGNGGQGGRGFPGTIDDAIQQCCMVAVPKEFVMQCFDKGESRGGKDARGLEIHNFPAYVRTEWKYEQDRIHRERNGTGSATSLSGADKMIFGDEYKRADEAIKQIRASYGDHQTMSKEDRDKLGVLLARRKELKNMLGLVA